MYLEIALLATLGNASRKLRHTSGREVYYAIVAAAAQRYREGEEVYWHDIVAAAAQRYREGGGGGGGGLLE